MNGTTDDSKLTSAYLDEKEQYRNLEAMRLHSTMELSDYRAVIRVVGGWIYYSKTDHWACFVPDERK